MMISTLKTADITSQYFRFGNPDGQPFVIIPGVSLKRVAESAELVAAQYSQLAESFDIYLFDRREDMPARYSIYDMADDTVKTMEALSLKQAIIYGVSQGGMIAMTAAVNRPDLVSRIVTCSAAAYIPDSTAEIMAEWAEYAGSGNIHELVKSFAEKVYSAEYCEKYSDALAAFGSTVTADDLHRFAVTLRGCEGFDIRPQLNSIKCPLLVLAAEGDDLIGCGCSEDIAAHTGGELHIYPESSHAVYDEDPDVITRIKEFALR